MSTDSPFFNKNMVSVPLLLLFDYAALLPMGFS